MSTWIKLHEIPDDFWGECFVGWKSNHETFHVDTSIVMVRKFWDGCAKWYCDSLKEWFDFRTDLEYRLMVVNFPTISEDAFND